MENQDSSSTPGPTLVENQSYHSVLSDHQLDVNGVTYRELKELNLVVIQDGPDAGKDEQVLFHTRSIGDKNYTVKKIKLEGSDPGNEETEEVVDENFWTSAEFHAFREDWDKNWNPSLGQPKEGGFKGFFKKMLGYE